MANLDLTLLRQTLIMRFAAPLPEFYQRRIIFWNDEDREFEETLDELNLPDVTIVKLTGTNNFAVKKLLLHDDLTGNYLIYNPISYEHPQDDWLRDIEKFSEEYRADYYSMLMSELNIEATPIMRKTVKTYSTFFANKDRVKKLRQIGRDYHTPLQLHIDIMAVLAGCPGGTAQDVIIAVFEAGLDEADNAALTAIQKFGNLDAFWQLVRKYTGFIHEDGKTLGEFAAHILLTAQTQTMNASVFKALERFLSESNQAYCYSIVHEWRSREDNESLFALCRTVEQELQLPTRFDRQDVDTLLTGDVFPSIHESILKRFFSEIGNQVVRTDAVLKVTENRRTSGWFDRFSDYYDCLYYLAKMQEFYQENTAGFHIVEPKAVWQLYTETAYLMDQNYRHFHVAYGNTLVNGNELLDDGLKQVADHVEAIYKNWYLTELSGCWTNAVRDDLATLGYVSEIRKQRDFYAHYVRPLGSKNTRAFVIISDALRYEVAAELMEQLVRNTKGTAKLEAMQSTFPAITKFGMAALLPGRALSVNEKLEVLMDDMPTRSTVERGKVLAATEKTSVAVQYADVLDMSPADRQKLGHDKKVVYIYHNTIDNAGDKPASERKVFAACEEAIQEISNLVRILINYMNATDIFITADHGFLYTYRPLNESDKVSRDAFSGEIYEVGRRYALTAPSTTADYLMPVHMEGMEMQGYTPQDSTRIKITGGGENYVHGGTSLQELVVPVICFKNISTKSKKYVEVTNAELGLLSESRKVSNLLFSLDFLQKQPVGDKVKPCAYSIYMTDDLGEVISDRQTIIADRTSNSAADRVFRIRLNLKAGAYDRNKIYRLVIANDTDVPEEVEFRIDIAFADDFGFDL